VDSGGAGVRTMDSSEKVPVVSGSVVNVNDDDDAVFCHGLFDGPISDLSSPVSFNFSLFLSCHTANILWADEQENFPSLH
jgi:hypothetical protein